MNFIISRLYHVGHIPDAKHGAGGVGGGGVVRTPRTDRPAVVLAGVK